MNRSSLFVGRVPACLCTVLFALLLQHTQAQDPINQDEMQQIQALEKQRIDAIDRVMGSVVAIYGEDRQGGGSGVLIDPSGIALTNHHVIIGAGIQGWGGLADGKLYRWKLIGTDPGGDVALIQLTGQDAFPFSRLGDSDRVQVGDWALAMGNPFILTEDQKPTVTLGIVSGVKRYQPGAGANQLVYGNCIQVDSSINPGNSGGPLFNLAGEIIGINGRGSFKDRGRVNVGLGYAISANQIRNFLPDLLATKLVEHGTLDANFSDRGGKVVCSTINQDSPIAQMGLQLGDELLEFEGIPIQSANQFTNLVCTLPEDWPAKLKVRSEKGTENVYHVRMFGLPYAVPKSRPRVPKGRKPSPEEKQKLERAKEMFDLLAAPPGVIRNMQENRSFTRLLFKRWRDPGNSAKQALHWVDQTGSSRQSYWLNPDGSFRIEVKSEKEDYTILHDLNSITHTTAAGNSKQLTRTEAKLNPYVLQTLSVLAASGGNVFDRFGTPHLDGGDKADRRPAYRFKWIDDDQDWFYAWLQIGENDLELAKVSPDKDANQKTGAILFRDWKPVGRWQFPHTRWIVADVSESPRNAIELKSIDLVDVVTLDSKGGKQ